VLALASLTASAVLVAEAAQFLISNRRYVVLGLIGLALAVASGWTMVTHRGPLRWAGLAGLLVGGAGVVAASVGVTIGAGRLTIEAGVFAVLALLAVGSGRQALRPDGQFLDERHRRPTGAPRHPVLLCNPWSGGGKVARFGLVALAEERGVEAVVLEEGLDLEELARDAVRRGADCLGMAGGDGSQALVASIAVEHDLPFVCVTAGTRNHFALDLGLDRDDPRTSLDAFTDAIERRVDYATVNGRFFVNNVSLGVYAAIVQQEQYRQDKVGTSTALLPRLLGEANEPFDLQFTDPTGAEVVGPFLVEVSNNPYVLDPSPELSQRLSIDSGRLGVFATTGRTGAEAARTMALSAIGQRRRSPNWHEFTTTEFEVRSRSGRAFAGVDGEALELSTPLSFTIVPQGLRLLVPRGNLAAAERRRARRIRVRDLVSVARGTSPADADLR
jgi:diacylglycerol kinase family enzyme